MIIGKINTCHLFKAFRVNIQGSIQGLIRCLKIKRIVLCVTVSVTVNIAIKLAIKLNFLKRFINYKHVIEILIVQLIVILIFDNTILSRT